MESLEVKEQGTDVKEPGAGTAKEASTEMAVDNSPQQQVKLLLGLVGYKARALVKRTDDNRPITVQLEDPLHVALGKLSEANILAAPVLTADKTYCGFLEMSQLVDYVIQLCGYDTKRAVGVSKNRAFRQTMVAQVMGSSPPGIPYESSMYLALEILASTGVHRIPVINYYNNVVSIVTQSQLVHWLASNMHLMSEDMRELSVADFKPHQWVLSARASDTALSTFQLMQQRRVNAMAVVNDEDQLVDVVSVRDLRGLGSGSVSFGGLWGSVKTLKANVRELYPMQTPVAPVFVLQSDTFGDVLRKMDADNVHQIFVVRSREDPVPINTITQTDVLRFVVQFVTRKTPGQKARVQQRGGRRKQRRVKKGEEEEKAETKDPGREASPAKEPGPERPKELPTRPQPTPKPKEAPKEAPTEPPARPDSTKGPVEEKQAAPGRPPSDPTTKQRSAALVETHVVMEEARALIARIADQAQPAELGAPPSAKLTPKPPSGPQPRRVSTSSNGSRRPRRVRPGPVGLKKTPEREVPEASRVG